MAILYFPRYSRIYQNISAHLNRIKIDDTEISRLIQEFDFDLKGQPWNMPYGNRGSNVAIHTSDGKKVVRRYRKKWKKSTINYEHSILTKLAELNSPAPRLNRTSDSRGLITLNGINFALVDFIEGNNYSSLYMIRSQRLALLESAAKALAQLHRCMMGFTPEGQHHLGFKSLTGKRNRDLEWHRMKIVELTNKSQDLLDSNDGESLLWLINNSEKVLGILTKLDLDIGKRDLPRVVIHGDYGLHNLLFQESGNVTPLDFELARIEWRLTDFVISFLKFRKRKGIYDFELLERFVKAYRLENPIDRQEWSLFPMVWQYNLLQFSIQYWNSYFETNRNAARLDLARDAIDQSEWAKNNMNKLVS